MSSMTVKNSTDEKKEPSHVLPLGEAKKFSDSSFDDACERMSIVVGGGEIKERSCKSYPPAKYFDDPILYWRMVSHWASLLIDRSDNEIAELESLTVTVTDEDGNVKTLTGKDARLHAAKESAKEYREAQQVKRAVKDPSVHAAIASDDKQLKSILSQADPAVLQAMLDRLQAEQAEQGGAE